MKIDGVSKGFLVNNVSKRKMLQIMFSCSPCNLFRFKKNPKYQTVLKDAKSIYFELVLRSGGDRVKFPAVSS